MQQLAFIALGVSCGAVLRYALSSGAAVLLGRTFPFCTLLLNVLVSFAIGLLFVVLTERVLAVPGLRAFLVVGLLVALTTFSTFSVETLQLVETGAYMRALLNVLLNVVLCLLACGFGLALMRHL